MDFYNTRRQEAQAGDSTATAKYSLEFLGHRTDASDLGASLAQRTYRKYVGLPLVYPFSLVVLLFFLSVYFFLYFVFHFAVLYVVFLH